MRWPRKCCSSLISRRARLARIFLLKTLVTFLMATPSLVWLFTAALLNGECLCQHAAGGKGGRERGVSQKTAARIPDNAVSSLAQLLGDSISLVDDEVLVKHLEHLTALEISHGGQCARCRGVEESYGVQRPGGGGPSESQGGADTGSCPTIWASVQHESGAAEIRRRRDGMNAAPQRWKATRDGC